MKNTKKFLAIILSVLFILSVGAIGATAKTGTEKTTKATTFCTTKKAKQTTTKAVKKTKKKSKAKASKVNRSGKMITINYKKVINVKDPKVSIVDEEGNEYKASFVKATRKSLKVKVSGLKKGKSYKVTVTGVKLSTETDYGYITVTYKYGK